MCNSGVIANARICVCRLALSHNQMGLLLLKMKRYDEARYYLESALDMRIAKLSENHSEVAHSRFNLGAHSVKLVSADNVSPLSFRCVMIVDFLVVNFVPLRL